MMNRNKKKPTLTQLIAREAASQVVDYDFAGNPITEADVMLMGAYGPIIERIVTLARTPLLEEIEKLKDQIVSVFDAEHPPTFRQGHPIHELEEVLKAETVTSMAKRITDLEVMFEAQSRMMKYYSEYADMQSQEALVIENDDQTRLAIDTATAMRVYTAAGIADTGKKVIEARAGATQITVNTRESK